jgi:hypothetical protein
MPFLGFSLSGGKIWYYVGWDVGIEKGSGFVEKGGGCEMRGGAECALNEWLLPEGP